jgi:hypothetical protein
MIRSSTRLSGINKFSKHAVSGRAKLIGIALLIIWSLPIVSATASETGSAAAFDQWVKTISPEARVKVEALDRVKVALPEGWPASVTAKIIGANYLGLVGSTDAVVVQIYRKNAVDSEASVKRSEVQKCAINGGRTIFLIGSCNSASEVQLFEEKKKVQLTPQEKTALLREKYKTCLYAFDGIKRELIGQDIYLTGLLGLCEGGYKRNTTAVHGGEHIQWVFGSGGNTFYIYTRNDVITSYQE